MRSKKDIQLLMELESAAALHGYELVDIERAGSGRNALLRIYIDKQDGLTLDDIAEANSWISEVVETLDPYKESYTLEVSSPGIDRPLRTFPHFERAIGQQAHITLDSFLATGDDQASGEKPRLKFTGSIVGADSKEQIIILKTDEETYSLPFEQIKKAKIRGSLDFEGRKDS